MAELLDTVTGAGDALQGEGTLTLTLDCDVTLPRSVAMPARPARSGGRARRHGSGIAAGVLTRISERCSITKETGKGTGLGLSQVVGFAKRPGGDVTLGSEPGRGTALTLRLQEAEMDFVTGEEDGEAAPLEPGSGCSWSRTMSRRGG